jgi:cyclopropane-fatty-acyl-phospholipid synthase
MNLLASAIDLAERTPLPDTLSSAGISWLVGRTERRLDASPDGEDAFLANMSAFPIAIAADTANAQHYELPPALFAVMLGPRLKYSCCLFDDANTTLAEAEIAALDATIAHADLSDGQDIMEWGCGWGSLTLRMAEHFPKAHILAVTNSSRQREFILARAAERGLGHVEVVRADMNAFKAPRKFNRIVSVEMFEHMSNWRALLTRAREALTPEGRLFLHVFTHKSRTYRFDPDDPTDWIARHFFTGGVMPAHDLPHRFGDLFSVEAEWRWSGRHYQRTAAEWLAKFDARKADIDLILLETYGSDAARWRRRWRLFLLATIGLFGHAGGNAWGVGHYRLAPTS